MYSWASPDYMLDHMTWDEIIMYYEKGIAFEETKSKILISTYGKALNNETETKTEQKAPKRFQDQTPDRAAFHARYGNKIKRG